MAMKQENHELREALAERIKQAKEERDRSLPGNMSKCLAYLLYILLLPMAPVALTGPGNLMRCMLVPIFFALLILLKCTREPVVEKVYALNLSHLVSAALLMMWMIIIGELHSFAPIGIMGVFVGLMILISSKYMVDFYKGKPASLGLIILKKFSEICQKYDDSDRK